MVLGSSPVAVVIAIKVTQVTFACSKSIIETLEKGVKYIWS